MPPSAAITAPGKVLRALTARTTIGQYLTSTIKGLQARPGPAARRKALAPTAKSLGLDPAPVPS